MTRHEMYFPEVPLQRGQNSTPVEECFHLLPADMEPNRSRKLAKASRIPLTPTRACCGRGGGWRRGGWVWVRPPGYHGWCQVIT